jgi:hypothetical protein
VFAVVLLGGIAIGCLGGAVSAALTSRSYSAHGRSVSAVVQTAEYVRGLGSEITVTLEGGYSGQIADIADPNAAPSGLQAGQQVTVLYDPSSPGHAEFPSQHSWPRPIVLGLIGFIALLLCVERAVAMMRSLHDDHSAAGGSDRSPFPGWGPNTGQTDSGSTGYVDCSNEPLFPRKRR